MSKSLSKSLEWREGAKDPVRRRRSGAKSCPRATCPDSGPRAPPAPGGPISTVSLQLLEPHNNIEREHAIATHTTMTETGSSIAAPVVQTAPGNSKPSTSNTSSGDGAETSAAEQHRQIQNQLEHLLRDLQKREPLDATYEQLLPAPFRKSVKSSLNVNKAQKEGADGKKSNSMAADVKLHRRLNANLRSTVETYASTPAGWKRRPNTRRIDIDFGASKDSSNTATSSKNEEIESKLRAAFALRESKEHEQRDLVNATLKAENAKLRRGWGLSQVTSASGGVGAAGGQMMFVAGMPPLEESSVRKKRLEVIAKQLKDVEKGAAERMKLRTIAEKGRDMVSLELLVNRYTKRNMNENNDCLLYLLVHLTFFGSCPDF